MTPRLRYLTIAAVDFAAALEFYDAVLPAAGWLRVHELVDEEQDDPEVEAAAWSAGDGGVDGGVQVWLVAAAVPTTGAQVSLEVATGQQVRAAAAAGVRAGGTMRSAPRPWAIYRGGRLLAELADPAGNVVELVTGE